jgi:hypothetical protein
LSRALCFAALFLTAACGGAQSGQTTASATPASSAIADTHRARCGACHKRVEPGERSRAEFETALSRHRKRVHLSEEQWAELVDYLGGPAPP